jgi:hypothetical protein
VLALAVSFAAGCGSKPVPVAPAPPPPPAWDIRLARDDASGRDVFDVYNLNVQQLNLFAASKPSTEEWHSWFSVTVVGDDSPPLLGEYVVAGDMLRFRPRFPLVPGLSYQATVRKDQAPDKPSSWPRKVFEIPKPPPGPPVQVQLVYPTVDAVPENLLKFYIHFTGPMRTGEAFEYIRLVDPAGKTIERAFLELGEELWDRRGQRFTLLIDPGRIKQGLKPREDLGPVLVAGKNYTLVIDGRWRDATGQPLGRDYKKSFRTTAAVELPVEPADWKLTPPAAGTRGPLTVVSQRPLDNALFQRVLHVVDATDNEVEGDVTVSEHETRWQFTPRLPWAAGSYNLEVEQILEDLAGNSVGRTFEVDEEKPPPAQQKRTRLPFTIVVKP